MLRFLAILLLLFFVYRVIRSLFRAFSGNTEQRDSRNHGRTDEKKKSKIKHEDIIEAEFEEIKEDEKEKENEKNKN